MSGLHVNVQKNLSGFRLDVMFEVGNELAVIFGPSGAGKSVTLQIIAGLIKPDSGTVRMGSRLVYDKQSGINMPSWVRHVGYVFQELALFPHLNVMENILYGVSDMPRDKRMAESAAIISEFQIAGLERRMPAELSGGQRQRVALARALMRQPEVLLLDEPFSALDYQLRHEMRAFLLQLRQRHNIPVLLVTHDVNEAVELADKLIMFRNGNVIYSGSPACSPLGPSQDDYASDCISPLPSPYM